MPRRSTPSSPVRYVPHPRSYDDEGALDSRPDVSPLLLVLRNTALSHADKMALGMALLPYTNLTNHWAQLLVDLLNSRALPLFQKLLTLDDKIKVPACSAVNSKLPTDSGIPPMFCCVVFGLFCEMVRCLVFVSFRFVLICRSGSSCQTRARTR
jgi:hypothetical protein